MDTKANFPNSAQHTADPTQADLRRCKHCCALLPIQAYGLFKAGPKGFAVICKECRSEINRTKWTKKHGRKRPLDPSITRSVRWHNRHILNQLIHKKNWELCGFDYVTKMEFKVFYGPSERHGMQSLACFNRAGTVYFDYGFSGIQDVVEFLLDNLKVMNIRLEWTDADIITSKQIIYYYK